MANPAEERRRRCPLLSEYLRRTGMTKPAQRVGLGIGPWIFLLGWQATVALSLQTRQNIC